MDENALRSLLQQLETREISTDDALRRLRRLPFEDLTFAKVDHHRSIRCGFPEVVYCEGKTVEQVAEIVQRLASEGGNLLATRATRMQFDAVSERFPEAEFHERARAITIRKNEARLSTGMIAILSAGTSDEPVAEEARVTAEIMDQRVETHYDVGVAGLHRLLAQCDTLQRANVVVAVAGMEGALPSVVGGLVGCPVIAVPTSVGYGASFGGVAALLAMLNSCATGVTVVNIDSGFSAGYTAALINNLADKDKT